MKFIGLILLLLPLSGCFAGEPGCSASIPGLTGGSTFLYEVEGVPRALTMEPIAQWSPTTSNFLELGKGSTMQISIADSPQERLRQDGVLVGALQGTYRISPADGRPPLDFHDEWYALETAQTTQSVIRRYTVAEDGRIEHFVAFWLLNTPGFMTSAMFWRMNLGPSDSGTLEIPAYPSPTGNPSDPISLDWSVIRSSGSPCQAVIEATAQTPYGPADILMTMESGNAAPVEFRIEYEPAPSFHATLKVHSGGTGPEVGRFVVNESMPPPELRAHAGFPAGSSTAFELQYDQAREAAMNDSTVAQWLAAHEGAEVTHAEHRMGSGGRSKEGWIVSWTDGSDGLEAIVQQMGAGIPIVEPEGRDVQAFPGSGPRNQAEDLQKDWITLPWLVGLHDALVGVAPEVVICGALADRAPSTACQVGTHRGMNVAHIDKDGGRVRLAGLVVLADQGIVQQENSWDSRVVGAPVSPGSLV